MTRLPTKLFLQCVEELNHRENEGQGSWLNGVPECYREAARFMNIEGVTLWVSVVDSCVKSQCLMIVSQLGERTLWQMKVRTE